MFSSFYTVPKPLNLVNEVLKAKCISTWWIDLPVLGSRDLKSFVCVRFRAKPACTINYYVQFSGIQPSRIFWFIPVLFLAVKCQKVFGENGLLHIPVNYWCINSSGSWQHAVHSCCLFYSDLQFVFVFFGFSTHRRFLGMHALHFFPQLCYGIWKYHLCFVTAESRCWSRIWMSSVQASRIE